VARPLRVFYSWQSDLPNRCNRSLIQDALERAAQGLGSDQSVDIEPVIDRDTLGAPGAPGISDTILEKVEASDLVVADVSIIGAAAGRPTPNPNVLLELGYAVRSKGWDRVLPVANLAFGVRELLPFDLRHRRICGYSMEPSDAPAEARAQLMNAFRAAMIASAARPLTSPTRPVRVLLEQPGYNEPLEFHLSREAQALLLEAARDPHGSILSMAELGHDIIQTNGKNLMDGARTARERASWTASLRALEEHELIEAVGFENQVKEVTERGYQVADELAKVLPSPIPQDKIGE